MNNIKALPGCFRGSSQLGQTIVIKEIVSADPSTANR